MKYVSFIALGVLGATISGCGGTPPSEKPAENATPTNESQVSSSDIPIISEQLRIKQNAENSIAESVNKENKRLMEHMANIDQAYAKTYSGAVIKTNMGEITVKLYSDDSPITVSNFLQLAEQKLYNGTTFHRVIQDFMIQGGDPNSKDSDPDNDGQGGPGYSFADEFNNHKLVRGSLAMANSGPNTNGSQFFIVTAESTPWLDGKHTNFGEVTKGMDIVEKIASVKTNGSPFDRPIQNVTITGIDLIKK